MALPAGGKRDIPAEAARHGRRDSGHLYAAHGRRQLRRGAPDDDGERVWRGQRGVADDPGQVSRVAVSQLVRRKGPQQRCERGRGVVRPRRRVMGQPRRHRRGSAGGRDVEAADRLAVVDVAGWVPPQRRDPRGRPRRRPLGAGPEPRVPAVPRSDRAGRGHCGEQQPDAEPDRDRQDDQSGNGLAPPLHGQPQPKPDCARPVHTGTASVPFERANPAHSFAPVSVLIAGVSRSIAVAALMALPR